MPRWKSMAAARPRRTTLDERDLRRLTLRVPVEVHEAFLTLARTRGLSMNQLAVDALHEFLLRNGDWRPVEDWLLRTGQRYRAAVQELEEASKPDPPWWAG
jgi:hypothetical protein